MKQGVSSVLLYSFVLILTVLILSGFWFGFDVDTFVALSYIYFGLNIGLFLSSRSTDCKYFIIFLLLLILSVSLDCCSPVILSMT